MRALVTGASGFVGSALAGRLLAEGAALRVLARDPGRLGGLAAEAVRGDVADEAALDRATAGGGGARGGPGPGAGGGGGRLPRRGPLPRAGPPRRGVLAHQRHRGRPGDRG